MMNSLAARMAGSAEPGDLSTCRLADNEYYHITRLFVIG